MSRSSQRRDAKNLSEAYSRNLGIPGSQPLHAGFTSRLGEFIVLRQVFQPEGVDQI